MLGLVMGWNLRLFPAAHELAYISHLVNFRSVENRMRAYSLVALSLLLSLTCSVFAAEHHIEGFARILAASNEGAYASDRGVKAASSWEYARDGEQRVEWETAPVPPEISADVVVFVWSASLDGSTGSHELSLNGTKILEFVAAGPTERHSWKEGPFELEFEPSLVIPGFQMHGTMRLRVPPTSVVPGAPATLAVRGLPGGGAWFMVHHFVDAHAYASTGNVQLPSGRRLAFAPPGGLFKAPGMIAWHGPFLVGDRPTTDGDTSFRLDARLQQDNGDEQSLSQQIHARPDQQKVAFSLWPVADVPQGTHLLQLAVNDEHGNQLAAWQGQIVVHHLGEYGQRKQRAEQLAAQLATDADISSSLRRLSLPGVAYRLVQVQAQIDALLDTAQFVASYAEALQSTDETLADLRQIAAGNDPYAGATGYVDRAYRSELDGSLQPYATYVPLDYDATRSYPLVVMLHGFGGSGPPQGAIRSLLGVGDRPCPDCQHIVVAPANRGNIFYTNRIGEQDVWRAMAQVQELYRIDENRVYLTGNSMGGQGTWHLGLHYADRFAAIVPICGSTDWRLWMSDAQLPGPLRQQVLDAANPINFAENATNLPVLVAHGGADPTVDVEHSRRMVAQLELLGLPVDYEEYPGVGHVSWNQTYKDGRILDWFDQHVRDPQPRQVVWSTTDPARYGRHYWVQVQALTGPRVPARIQAHVDQQNTITVTTQNLARFRLDLDQAPVDPSQEIIISIDGTEAFRGVPVADAPISFGASAAGFVQRTDDWVPALIPREGQHEARSGWRIYVYGTRGTPVQTTDARLTAERLAAPDPYVDIRYQVKADTAITEQDIDSADLILLGTPATHAVLARLHAELPIQFGPNGIAVGDEIFSEEDQLLVMIYPNPLNRGRYVQILGGTEAAQFAAAFRLSRLFGMSLGVPDYAILRPDGSAVTEGAFDLQWRLPAP
jgi:predicted peptidase